MRTGAETVQVKCYFCPFAAQTRCSTAAKTTSKHYLRHHNVCVCALVLHARIVFPFTLVVRDDIYYCTIVYKMYSVDLKNEDKIEKTRGKTRMFVMMYFYLV